MLDIDVPRLACYSNYMTALMHFMYHPDISWTDIPLYTRFLTTPLREPLCVKTVFSIGPK